MMQASPLDLDVPRGILANLQIGFKKDSVGRPQYLEPRPRRICFVERHYHLGLRIRALPDQQEEG